MIRRRYRVVDINVSTSTINPSPEIGNKKEAIWHARQLSRLDTDEFITIVQRKRGDGWQRIWPTKGPVIYDD